MFVSKTYGGHATDAEITVTSGFLDKICEGEVILADKGFPHIETDINRAGSIKDAPF